MWFYSLSIIIAILAVALSSEINSLTCPSNAETLNGILDINDSHYDLRPRVDAMKTFSNGIITAWEGDGDIVTSPIIDNSTGERIPLGKLPRMKSEDALKVLTHAKAAWKNGQGAWPQMTIEQRIVAIEKVIASLKTKRDEIIKVLMWEICKSTDDAAAEFDRTMIFIEAVIKTMREMDATEGVWKTVGGVLAKFRRVAIGIMLCLGPYNYPFNETYATLIPALLAGNIGKFCYHTTST
jgi:glyceraldehyde-3-phosphate dehydrogenase (NADP+)